MARKIAPLGLGLGFLVGSLIGVAPASAQDFYGGKVIRIVVGFAPGGGYDTYSRLIARHIGKAIPGNPRIVVENMDGAGSLIAANHVYRVAKPDGLTIGHFIGGLFVQQLLGRPGIEFDAQKFEYIGVPAQDNYMLGISKATGIKTLDEWIASKKVIKFGGVAPGSATDDVPKILKAALGFPIQVVSGFKGTAPIRLAFNSGEVEGVCNAWESFKATWRKEIDSGDLIMVLQNTAKPHPDLPKVALAINFAKTDEARKLIQGAVHTIPATARPYVLPPSTPKDRVLMLRQAFLETMRDPEFLAEAEKARLNINPLDGEELQRNVNEVFKLEPALITKLKEILK
jgi:tripartite-type tricarboxylate transporter receptor subunit TctC